MISKAFARLPDPVLLPWLRTLITTLRDQSGELMSMLVREAGWRSPTADDQPAGALPAQHPAVSALVGQHPATAAAVTQLLTV